MKVIKEDGRMVMSEDLDGFGLPGVSEATRINYKSLLNDLIVAAEAHMAIMAGEADKDAEDTLGDVLIATKEALEPKEEPEAEEPAEEPEPTEESVKKKFKKLTESEEEPIGEIRSG